MIPPQPTQQGDELKLDGLTREEVKRIQKSMKKPQFMGLLNQYMVEISDPKNKAEYDQYLKQMQKDGELPKHMKLIKLKPEFCLRTFVISSRNKTHEMKFFINMCSTDYIEKPSCQVGKDENDGIGYNWKVPNSIGKIRYDQDKQKKPCQVVDVGYHPDTFHFASHPAFQAMIINIALEGIQKQLGERKQMLSRDYVILKKVKCKGDNNQPALLPIRYIDGKVYNRGDGPVEQERNLEGKQTKLQKQINKQKQQYQYEKEKKKKPEESKENEEQIQEGELDDRVNKTLVEDMEKGIQTPKFTSIYTYKTDYSDFIDDQNSVRRIKQLPNTFTVQFKVPRMENISEANTLEINDKKIVLSVEGKYYIDISFDEMKVKSYPLKYQLAKAKFDKKKKTLRVQIPVDRSAVPQDEITVSKEQHQHNQNYPEQSIPQLIQQQTWKNKVLQLPQQTETNKFLSKSQAEEESKPKPKLVEEIDEDDYIEQTKPVKKEDEDQIEERNREQNIQNKQFTISTYYKNEKNELSDQQLMETTVQKLCYLFKQNSKFIAVMIYMRNYKDEDIKFVLNEQNCQFVLLWLNKIMTPSVIHILVVKEKKRWISKMEVLKKVGFYTLIIYKSNMGELWRDTSIENLFQSESAQYYQNLINKMLAQNESNKKKQQLEEQEKQSQAQKTMIEKVSQQKKQLIFQSNTEQIDETIFSQKHKQKQEMKQLPQINPFKKLPIQFIRFNVPFIEILN